MSESWVLAKLFEHCVDFVEFPTRFFFRESRHGAVKPQGNISSKEEQTMAVTAVTAAQPCCSVPVWLWSTELGQDFTGHPSLLLLG